MKFAYLLFTAYAVPISAFAVQTAAVLRTWDDRSYTAPRRSFHTTLAAAADTSSSSSSQAEVDLAYLKRELLEYLETRKELGADDAAKETVGQVVGGTKGNKILEYVSGSPNKAMVTEDAPNPLDYDELTKYGYGELVAPIMQAGGRPKMYELLGMDAPALKQKKKVIVPKLVIDRTGSKTSYQGLKLGQVLDDDMQGEALQQVQKKIASGERPSASLVRDEVDSYVLPFADKRNVGPKQTSDWTPERLDEWGKQQGRVESWARKAREGAFVKDPMESTDSLLLSQRMYSLVTCSTAAFAFGKATPNFLALLHLENIQDVNSLLQAPAAALVLASIGSSAYCAFTAGGMNRSNYVWGVKGMLGGPLTIRQLKSLPSLMTQKEQDDQDVN